MGWKPSTGTVLKAAKGKKVSEKVDGLFLEHKVYRLGAFHFRGRCGYFAEHRSIGLERPRAGGLDENYKPWLASVVAGRHPLSRHHLGMPVVPATAADAARWEAQMAVAARC